MVFRSNSGRLSVFIRWLRRCPGVVTRRVMPLRSRTFSDLRFSPPKRHPGTIRGNEDRHSRSANECACIPGLCVGHKRTHHVPPDLRYAPAAPAPPPGEGVGERTKSTREKKGRNKSPRCVSWGDETRAVSHEKTRQGSTPCHTKTSLEGILKQNHVDKRYKRYKKICSSGQKICEEQG